MLTHPAVALFDAVHASVVPLPVCDHYAGVAARMEKSLALQAERAGPAGATFDVTLDLEDGAPVGAEREHAEHVAALVSSKANRFRRVGVRVHDRTHPHFETDLATVVPSQPAYIMLPKVAGVADIERAAALVPPAIPLHALVESPSALDRVGALAAHPRVESISFGLMDFVSAHRGAIPESAMTLAGQFDHPLVVRAKLEIAAACHAHDKVPSHCVVTEFADTQAVATAARRAATHLGYMRMWSIHPAQIAPIIDAFAPEGDEVKLAAEVLLAAQAAHWAPIRHSHQGTARLHDRASYRYFWQVLRRAHQTGRELPTAANAAFFQTPLKDAA